MSKYFIFSRIPEYAHHRWYVGRIYPILVRKVLDGTACYIVGDNYGGSGWFGVTLRGWEWAYEIVDGPKEVTQKDIEELL